MRMYIRVVDAAYVDKFNSNHIVVELVPRYHVDEATRPSSPLSRQSPWPTAACVRSSDLIERLHQHLQRRYPLSLLPTFQEPSRKDVGWGTEAYLQCAKRRLQRYYNRLLSRPDVQEEGILTEFLSNKKGLLAAELFPHTTGSVWSSLSFGGWFGRRDINTVDEKLPFTPVNLELNEEDLKYQEGLEKSMILREKALHDISASLYGTQQAIERYAESFGRISKSLNELTCCHVRHLMSNNEDDEIKEGSSSLYMASDDIRGTERRFRELGDRFVDLVNQVRPGLQQICQNTSESVLEVTIDQHSELKSAVQGYINKNMTVLKKYDRQVGKREMIHEKRSSAENQVPAVNQRKLANLTATYEEAVLEEQLLKEQYDATNSSMRTELDLYWVQTSQEFYNEIGHAIKTSLQVSRIQADALQSWFPPPPTPSK